MRLGLSMYGTVFSMGLHPKSERPTITALDLLQRALEMGLSGVELPAQLLDETNIDAVKRFAREHSMFINVDTGGYDPVKLTNVIELSARVGAETVRTVVGGADFGGDRRPMVGRWSEFLRDVLAGFKEATRVAEQVGVDFAIENHQDLASEELVWLCESIGSKRFGINLDTGNPLATAEEPFTFFERVAPYLKNVHLKDYDIFLSDEGYRLVRCPLGQGVIDFPSLFQILSSCTPNMTMAIELGALEARHVRVLADDFWPLYQQRSAAQLAHVIRFVRDNARISGDWRTPYERGESTEEISRYEEHQLAASLAYLKGLDSSLWET
ncbi:sugar phosphate isomerase/epimerase [Alicyclobacillus fastidiosus]|uniref:Sugar phosphate isomerase/epimerase n=1 Tax=Alicyclobacillus fastidiosus TaxID=392011 RepID=A0ABY6ZAG9_9BACL|nr:sugar phosphate isomerase/epimerase family protein [Alicyclobacillus fastidiosus]WAH39748.1 sugar phosphate isomerase/epimerase [Alicyclobacillus fastidiosus]GMA60983.1 xylose isomerase [Alicyclobacillus fastidiosus]